MATYYVSNSGSDDTGNGTELNPWATPRKAGEVLTTGDTLFIRGGTYNVDSWNHTTGQKFCQAAGTSVAPILISAAIDSNGNFETVTFNGAVRRADSFNFLPHWLHWRGFIIPDGGFAPHGNSTSDRLIGWKISHCNIQGGVGDPNSVIISDASNVAGFFISDADQFTVEDCEISHIDKTGTSLNRGGDAFKLYNVSNLTVQNCYIHDNYQQAAGDKQGGVGNVWRRNIMKDNPYGEHMRISSQPDNPGGGIFNNNAEIYENIFITSSYTGSEIFGPRLRVKTDNAKVYNNVMYGCGGIQMSSDYDDATDPTEINTNAEVYNNIVMPTIHSSMRFFSSDRWDNNLPNLMDYNCFYGSYTWIRNRSSNPGGGSGERAVNTSSSLGAWQSYNSGLGRGDIDLHSINTNPLFVNPTSYTAAGFQLQAGSPCLGTGKDGLDMGCYPRRDSTVIGIRPFNSNPARNPVRARSIKALGRGRNW